MKVFECKEEKVTKYLHKDKSETAIKNNGICTNQYLNDKYVVFISSSVGCQVKCNFCSLKDCNYKPLSKNQIIKNVREAIEHRINQYPEDKEKLIKLSFMGMGDSFYNMKDIPEIVEDILDWVLENHYARGIKGVDIGTTFPTYDTKNFISDFNFCISELKKIFNRFYYRYSLSLFSTNICKIRIFYSLHSFDKETRGRLIPNLKEHDPIEAVKLLNFLCSNNEVELIFHQIFIADKNDNVGTVEDLVRIMNLQFPDNELRILKYNECNNLKQSDHFEYICQILKSHIKNIKIQHSDGSEIKASCGQFLIEN